MQQARRHSRVRAGQQLTRAADAATAKSFTLKSERYEDVEGYVETEKDWPFALARAKPNTTTIDEVEYEVQNAEKATYRVGRVPGIFKYTVAVVPVNGQAPPTLDPTLIVER